MCAQIQTPPRWWAAGLMFAVVWGLTATFDFSYHAMVVLTFQMDSYWKVRRYLMNVTILRRIAYPTFKMTFSVIIIPQHLKNLPVGVWNVLFVGSGCCVVIRRLVGRNGQKRPTWDMVKDWSTGKRRALRCTSVAKFGILRKRVCGRTLLSMVL